MNVHVAVAAKGFHPPWCDGIVSYSKGLLESLIVAKRNYLHLTITIYSSIRRRLVYVDNHDFMRFKGIVKSCDKFIYLTSGPSVREYLILVKALLEMLSLTDEQNCKILHACDPDLLWKAISTIIKTCELHKKLNIIFHINALSSFRGLVRHTMLNRILKRLNIIFAFSSQRLKRLHGIEQCQQTIVIPPAINTHVLKRRREEKAIERFIRLVIRTNSLCHSKAEKTFLSESLRSADCIITYIGPLSPERIPYRIVARSLAKIKHDYGVKPEFIAVFREGKSEYIKEFKNYMEKEGVENLILTCNKLLSEDEKALLFSLSPNTLFLYIPEPRPVNYPMVEPPISILEAMACEARVLASMTVGLLDVIENRKNGFIIEKPYNDAELAETMYMAISSQGIGRSARQTIEEKYSVETVAQLISHFYRKLYEK